MYPFAVIWMSMLTLMFVGNQFGKKYLSLKQLNEKLADISKIQPRPICEP
jgi:hypothetical protein